MEPWVIALVAVSAVLHLAWNVRLKTAGDPLRAATIGMLAASVGIVPLGIAVWWAQGRSALPVEGVALGVASGVVEAAYFILLSAAYRRGDLSVVYPLARGTAPLLAVFIGVVVLGERLGVAGLDRRRRCCWPGSWSCSGRGGRSRWPGAGGGRGAQGRRRQRDPVRARDRRDDRDLHRDRPGRDAPDRRRSSYAAILWATCSVVLVLWVAFVAGGDLLRYGPAAARRAAVGGWLTLAAYLCILVALSVAPLSGVAPLRESATVFAAAWGSVRMGEASDRSEAIAPDRGVGADRRRGAAAGGRELRAGSGARLPRSAAPARTPAAARTGC